MRLFYLKHIGELIERYRRVRQLKYMKAKLKLIRIGRKGIAGLIALLGVAALLSVVVFATPSDIPVGEMAYQKLWLGRMNFVFVICCVCSLSEQKTISVFSIRRNMGLDCIGRY